MSKVYWLAIAKLIACVTHALIDFLKYNTLYLFKIFI